MAKIPYTIYKITNLINGKIYIGQTKRKLIKRWCDHKTSTKGCTALIRAIKKYGKKSFKCEAIFSVIKKDHLDFYEIYFINYYKSFGKNGYNLNRGGHSLACNKLKKEIVGYNIKTGETVVFDRMSKAKTLKYDPRSIARCIKKEHYIHKNCFWFLKDDFTDENLEKEKQRYFNGLYYDRKNPYPGVIKTKNNSYVVFIKIKGKSLSLGTYKTLEQASAVYRHKFTENFYEQNPFY